MDHHEVAPDLTTMAKSLAGGFPLAAVTGRAEIMDAPGPGGLGGTYGGNPVACAAALAVLQVIDNEDLLTRATRIGERIRSVVGELQAEQRLGIGEIRGLGAMIAFALKVPGSVNTPDPDAAKALATRAADMGLILLTCGVDSNAIRVLVPLTVEDKILEEGLSIMADALRGARA